VELLRVITESAHLPVCQVNDRDLEFLTDVKIRTIDRDGCVLTAVMRAGDTWDGASIPRVFWRIVGHPLAPELRWASLWHDVACWEATTLRQRKDADRLFLFLLEEAGVSLHRRTAMWMAVRAYALTVWNVKRFMKG